jgi:hypothetical protein
MVGPDETLRAFHPSGVEIWTRKVKRRAQYERAAKRHEAKSDFELCQTTKGEILSDDDCTRFNYVVELGNYDGTSSLETFLAKFRNLAAYYRWNERDRVFNLRACLVGAAGQYYGMPIRMPPLNRQFDY